MHREIGRKKPRPCKGQAGLPGSRNRHSAACLSLTFRLERGLNRPNSSERLIFSTRRPALEAGGQRPTARCALGRKGVWTIVLAFAAKAHRSSSPAKAGGDGGD